MRVAVDLRMWRHSGAGRYLRELYRRLPALLPSVDWTWIANPDCLPELPDGAAVTVDVLEEHLPIYSPREQWVMARRLAASGADLVHWPHFNVPLLSPIPRVVTIYDLIYLLFPSSCPGFMARLYARFMYRHATSTALRVLTISERVRQDLMAELSLPDDRIIVTPCGAPQIAVEGGAQNLDAALASMGLAKGRYLLYVGIHIPHKNLARLVEAFAALGDEARDWKLVLAGKIDPRQEALYELARRAVPDGRIVFTDHVDEGRLDALYRGARAFVTPSLFEGFGLPPLEALARGCPVAASRAGSLPEVLGDGALWFDGQSVDDMVSVLQRCLRDDEGLAAVLERGQARLSRFSWDDCARRTAELFAEILGLVL